MKRPSLDAVFVVAQVLILVAIVAGEVAFNRKLSAIGDDVHGFGRNLLSRWGELGAELVDVRARLEVLERERRVEERRPR